MNRREFFEEQAAGWDGTRRADLDEKLRRVIGESGIQRGDSVLDVGTGTGVLVPHIACAVGADGLLMALDVARAMVARAREKAEGARALFARADAQELPCQTEVFDCVICNAALPHFEDRTQAVKEMARALRRGGTLVISHPIGRAAVNARHRAAGGPVGEDRVPAPEEMGELLLQAGLAEVAVIDEPEFYLARARKP